MTISTRQTTPGKAAPVTGDDDLLKHVRWYGEGSGAWTILPAESGWQFFPVGLAGGVDPHPALSLTLSAARPDHSGTGGTTATTATNTATFANAATASPFVINVNWDSSVASAPAAFKTGVLAAVQFLESQFSDPVTVNINVGYGELAGYALGGSLGSSYGYSVSVSYASLLAALKADQKTTTDAGVTASMPGTMPVSGTLLLSTAEAKALGLMPANGTSLDGYAGFSSTLAFDYDNSDGVTAGTYDFFGVAVHELTHLMGRTMDYGATTSHNYTFYDLLHFSAPGVRDLSASVPGYFSIDGGVTNLAAFNTVSGGDGCDWAASMGYDALDAFSYSGVVNRVSTADLTAVDSLGWDLTSAIILPPPPPPPPSGTAPTGVAVTATGATAAGATGGAAALAKITQTGGDSTHSFSYALEGLGASAFVIATVNNTATLSSGASGLAGSASGTLYALTLSTTDTTSALTSPTVPLDVIVGGSGGSVLSVAGLVGTNAGATPAFIYGGASNDTLNGSGMAGKLWFVGGGGADRMTGGAGGDTYIYGAASDSTATAMDVISNFAASVDVIDLTGLRTALAYAGTISTHGKNANMLAAHSIGFLSSGGDTYVYVNTGSASQGIASASMKIDLAGSVPLTAANFLHQ